MKMEYIEITSQQQLDELPLDYNGKILAKRRVNA